MIISRLFISGQAGSGKSTLLKRYKSKERVLILDLDEIGNWEDDGTNPRFMTDLDKLMDKVDEFEEIQKKDPDNNYLIIMAGFSYNIFTVSARLEAKDYSDIWIDVSKDIIIKRLIARAETCSPDNWWYQFKGKPELIRLLDLEAKPKNEMAYIDKEGILHYNEITKLIDSLILEMNEKNGKLKSENDADLDLEIEEKEEEEPTEEVDFTEPKKKVVRESFKKSDRLFNFRDIDLEFYIIEDRAVIVFQLTLSDTYAYWDLLGGEDHRLIVSAEGPFDKTLNVTEDASWEEFELNQTDFLEQVSMTKEDIVQLFAGYSHSWMLNTHELRITVFSGKG